MIYQALYRKYRPKTFSDISGQPHVTLTLKNQMMDGRVSHAYLFCGSRGTGKTSCAKILSKAVNCLSPQNGDPCCVCENCVGIEDGSILDVVEIDAASNNGVDNIRDLRERSEYTPAKAKYRVYIVDEVHMLSAGAFNALLKTLEEPPAHVIFILATTELHKLPATILSRCQRFDFNRITPNDISDRLKYVASLEEIVITDDAALLIARLADGAMRDALSLLDICAGTDKNITESVVTTAAGLAGRDYLFEIADAVTAADTGETLATIDRLYAASCDLEKLCDELISHFRNLMIIKTVKKPELLIVSTAEEMTRLGIQAKNFTLSTIIHSLLLLEDCLEAIKKGASRRIMLETTLIKLCMPELDVHLEAIVRRITTLETQMKSGGTMNIPRQVVEKPVIQKEKVIEEPVIKTEEKAVYHSHSGEMSDFKQWAEVLAELSKTAKIIHSYLHNSNAYIKGNVILINSSNSQFGDLIKGESKHREAIRKALVAITGNDYVIEKYILEEMTDAPKKVEADPLDDFLGTLGGL